MTSHTQDEQNNSQYKEIDKRIKANDQLQGFEVADFEGKPRFFQRLESAREHVEKNMNLTLKGRLGSDIEIKDIKIKDNTETKKVATFSVADNSKGKEPVWHNVQLWEDKFPKSINDLKKGDLIEIKGFHKPFETKEGKTKFEFVATEILSHQAKKELGENAKEKVTLKGNLGQDPVITQTINDKTVASFSIAVKAEGGEKINWQQVQVWNEAIEKNKIYELKKGDFVQLRGYYGKEYQNKIGETKQDFVLEESKVLKKKLENELPIQREGAIRI